MFGGLRPVSLFLEKLCAREMTEEAGAPSAKRPCTEARNTDHVSEQRSESAAPLAGPREEEEDDGRGELVRRAWVRGQRTRHPSQGLARGRVQCQ